MLPGTPPRASAPHPPSLAGGPTKPASRRRSRGVASSPRLQHVCPHRWAWSDVGLSATMRDSPTNLHEGPSVPSPRGCGAGQPLHCAAGSDLAGRCGCVPIRCAAGSDLTGRLGCAPIRWGLAGVTSLAGALCPHTLGPGVRRRRCVEGKLACLEFPHRRQERDCCVSATLAWLREQATPTTQGRLLGRIVARAARVHGNSDADLGEAVSRHRGGRRSQPTSHEHRVGADAP